MFITINWAAAPLSKGGWLVFSSHLGLKSFEHTVDVLYVNSRANSEDGVYCLCRGV